MDFLRAGRAGTREERLDLLWLLGLGLVLIATGMGWRDPWPADEPRFAVIARDMVASGQWLIPQVGADVYADKPPLFFWLLGLAMLVTHSVRAAFLVPSLLAGLGTVWLVYDLARRLWNRETGFAAGLVLLCTVQFVWQARQAQIDATLCFWTTLSLYGLLRHLLLGPQWRWYAVGWAAAGLGIISKGVGFLPLLIFIPYVFARRAQWHPEVRFQGGLRWLLGPLALLAAVSIWLAPMLIAATESVELARYRDEILFKQTVDRYASAWHHREPFWYFLINVIPVLWLPLTAFLPAAWPGFRAAWIRRDLRIWLPLAWTLIVVLFFSLSSGKRGVYVLPAVPALVLALAPLLTGILQRRGVQRTLFTIAAAIAFVTLAAAGYLLFKSDKRAETSALYGIDAMGPLLLMGVLIAAGCLTARVPRGPQAYGAAIAVILLVVSFWANPVMDPVRSGAEFMNKVMTATSAIEQVGVVAYKEQYLLQASRPLWNFGHARWREAQQEAADAAAWLSADPARVLIMEADALALCFKGATASEIGHANGEHWYLVSGPADATCVGQGHLAAARLYTPGILQSGQ